MCRVIQWTGFYMIETSNMKELKLLQIIRISLKDFFRKRDEFVQTFTE